MFKIKCFGILGVTILLLFIIIAIVHPAESSPLKTWVYMIGDTPLSRVETARLHHYGPELKVLCITGFQLNHKGSIIERINTKKLGRIRQFARKRGIALYPLISFKSVSDGIRLLSSESAITASVNGLQDIVKKHAFAGIHADFEYLPPRHARDLSRFLGRIRTALRPALVTMAVFPPVDFPQRLSGLHNLSMLTEAVDAVVIMCYDYHRPGSRPGPVTDVRWAEKNIRYAQRYFVPGRIWLGIPAYGYRWDHNGSCRAISAAEGVRLSRSHESNRDASGCNRIRIGTGIQSRIVYVSDSITRGLLEKIARNHHLNGIAIWRLGFED